MERRSFGTILVEQRFGNSLNLAIGEKYMRDWHTAESKFFFLLSLAVCGVCYCYCFDSRWFTGIVVVVAHEWMVAVVTCNTLYHMLVIMRWCAHLIYKNSNWMKIALTFTILQPLNSCVCLSYSHYAYRWVWLASMLLAQFFFVPLVGGRFPFLFFARFGNFTSCCFSMFDTMP